MGKITHHPIVPKIEAFLGKTGLSPTEFGKSVANDSKLVFELRRGRDLRGRTATRIEAFMESYS
jgi:hypothetical protein